MNENVLTNYKITERKIVFDGYTKVEEVTIDNGKEKFTREVLKTGSSVCGIIKDTAKNKYIFVSQYRPGSETKLIEIVAGQIDEGEQPEEALKREVMEETGYKVDFIKHLKDCYTSPGRVDEIMSIFYVEVSEKINEGGGIGDEDIEIIEVEALGLGGRIFFDNPREVKVVPHQLIDAKSLIAVMIVENSNILKDMADVITQAKLRSL